MALQLKKKTQQNVPGRNTTVIHLVGISLTTTIVICLLVYLDHKLFWANIPETNRPDDTNIAVYNKDIRPDSIEAKDQPPRLATRVGAAGWAQRLDVPGLPNFYKVSDDLYRGAQPTAEGMRQLKKLGIKTIVNLRSMHSDRDKLGDMELAYEHINMTTLNPQTEDIVRFLQIVTDSNRTPVFVHCQHGADRTGMMCAVYRIAVQGWSKDQAIEEMTRGGFGFHSIWKNMVDYIRHLDIDKIKQKAGMIK